MVKKTAISFPSRDAVSFDFFLDSYVFSSRFVDICTVSYVGNNYLFLFVSSF